jgi:osmotically-inducible protein OsmY
MAEKNIKRLPVMENGRMIGIVTRSDIMAALVRELASFGAAKSDADIRGALDAELRRQSWGQSVGFEVEEGVVTLTGNVFDQREKTGLRVAAENTIGVRRVEDRIEVVVPPAMPVPPPGFYP